MTAHVRIGFIGIGRTEVPTSMAHLKRYPQLFFLDETAALAAGHQPCGECRRKHYRCCGSQGRRHFP